VVEEALAAEVGLGQAVTLDERSGGAIEHENPLAKQRAEQEQALLTRPDGANRRLGLGIRGCRRRGFGRE
jgi:hypothetical protein